MPPQTPLRLSVVPKGDRPFCLKGLVVPFRSHVVLGLRLEVVERNGRQSGMPVAVSAISILRSRHGNCREHSNGQASQDQVCSPERIAENFPSENQREHEVPRKAAPIGEFLSVTAPSLKKARGFGGCSRLDSCRRNCFVIRSTQALSHRTRVITLQNFRAIPTNHQRK
jgi:hypothetical protein